MLRYLKQTTDFCMHLTRSYILLSSLVNWPVRDALSTWFFIPVKAPIIQRFKGLLKYT